jgi:hypothetical protein
MILRMMVAGVGATVVPCHDHVVLTMAYSEEHMFRVSHISYHTDEQSTHSKFSSPILYVYMHGTLNVFSH